MVSHETHQNAGLADRTDDALRLSALDRLAKTAGHLTRTEASLLREALDDLFNKLR